MKKFYLLTLLGFAFLHCISQDFSNKGKDFWVGYPGHIDGNSSRMALYISSDVNTSGTVFLNGSSIPFSVTANQATVVQIFPATYAVINPQSEGIGVGKGIHITSLLPVVVYAHVLNAARSGSTLVLPTNTLGREYIATSFKSTGNSSTTTLNNSPAGSQFTIVAVENNTTVEIIPSVPDAGNIRSAGNKFTITLNQGDVYQYRSTYDKDITGTKITSTSTSTNSCKPIAVFSGSSWTSMDCTGASGGDNLFMQLMPKSAWGKNYVTAPFADRSYDIFRIIVSDSSTIVSLNGNNLPLTSLINKTYYQFTSTIPNEIISDKPIMVVQYMVSQTCDTRNISCGGANQAACPFPGDPEMVVINPIEQTINDVTVVSARNNLTPPNTNIIKHFFTIIMKSNATSTLTIDGSVPAGIFKPIAASGYSYLQENVTNSTTINPSHRIKADSGFIALAYGMGQVESYGYNAGTNVKDLYQHITIHNQFATVDFPATCRNSPFNFEITLPYKPTTLTWDFNNNPNLSPNSIIINNNPIPDDSVIINGKSLYIFRLSGTYTFKAIGTYPVKVTANNPTPDGCSGVQEINYDVSVYDPPIVDFRYTHTGCLSDSVHFFDATNGNGRPVIKWLWDFGDNSIDSVRNPFKKYSAAAIYNVKLQAITDVGCISDTTKPITISAQPIAKFGISTPDCFGKTITFFDSSAEALPGNIVKWYWDYGDGSKDSFTVSTNPTHLYAATGNYNVTLIVQSNTGCKSNPFIFPVTVHPNPLVNFSLPPVCLPIGFAQFFDSSTIADGSQSQFTYLWDFGDPSSGTLNNNTSKNPTHNYNNTGPFTVKLQVTSKDGCTSDTTKILSTVYARPGAGFIVNTENCLNDTTYFTDQSSGAGNTVINWFWNFGDSQTSTLQNPSHKYASAGTYNVTLYIVTDKGCLSDTLTKQVIINPLPTASFTASSPSCETKAITFTDASIANAGNIVTWYWDFGDGAQQTLNTNAPFTHTYSATGNFTVTLYVLTNKGCKSSVYSKQIIVHSQPVVNFLLPQICLKDAFAQFTDSSYIADIPAGAFTYLWNFGDPASGALNTSTLKNPQHKYNSANNYNVTLTVTSSFGCVSTLTKAFTVNGSTPKADFAVLNSSALCSNTIVQIQNKSTVDFGALTKVEIYWDYINAPALFDADATPSLNKTYSHLYPNFQQPLTKTFSVRFRSYSGGSCVDEITKIITVNATPKVQFNTIRDTCYNINPFQITQASETGNVPGTGVYSGPGIVNASGIFDPKSSGVGTFTIRYTFTSNKGCVDFQDQTINILAPPIANFGFSYPDCVTRDVTFSDSSITTTKSLTTWTWNFGDGTTVTKNSPAPFTHIFAAAKTYNVTLTVTTLEGCSSSSFTKSVTINPLPVPDFSLPKICLPNANAQFNDLSTITDGTASQFKYLWNFGDANSGTANTSSLKNPAHIYTAVGPYNVSLQITTNNGCVKDTTKIYNDIHPQPKAKFVFDPSTVCLGTPINFTDQSNGLDGTIQQYQWSFGDGSTSSQQNPVHNYSLAGTYNISLYITNSNGCVSDTSMQSAIVYPFPNVNAGPDRTVLEGGTITLEPIVTGNDLQYLWTPNQYLSSNIIVNPIVSGVADITYTLTVTARGGCVSSDQVAVKVLKFPKIPNTFTPNGDGINDTWVIENLETYPQAHVEVFNRYGQLVFESTGYTKPWNGAMNGKSLPFGTYYYVIEPGNGRKPITGYVTIIK